MARIGTSGDRNPNLTPPKGRCRWPRHTVAYADATPVLGRACADNNVAVADDQVKGGGCGLGMQGREGEEKSKG